MKRAPDGCSPYYLLLTTYYSVLCALCAFGTAAETYTLKYV